MRVSKSILYQSDEEEFRFARSLNLIYVVAIFVHLALLVLFGFYGAKKLFYINIASPLIYFLAFILNTRRYSILAVAIGLFEAISHSAICCYHLGWESNFHYYFILGYLVIFFVPNMKLYLKIIITGTLTAIIIALYIYNNPEPYVLPENIISILGISNLVVIAIVLSIFTFTYSYFVQKSVNSCKENILQQKALMKQKNQFFSIFSHDLKNPLTTLQGFTEMLQNKLDKLDSDKRKMYVETINNSVVEIRELVSSLLEWSRAQRDDVEAKPVHVDVVASINKVIRLLEAHINKKSINVVLKIPEPLHAYVDQHMFETILRNLVSNAVKYSPVCGDIIIKATKNQHCAVISVHDDGVGIAPEDIDGIFSIEKRNVRKGTDSESGHGIGLVVTKDYVDLNNGAIKVHSMPGRGSSFIVSFPSEPDFLPCSEL